MSLAPPQSRMSQEQQLLGQHVSRKRRNGTKDGPTRARLFPSSSLAPEIKRAGRAIKPRYKQRGGIRSKENCPFYSKAEGWGQGEVRWYPEKASVSPKPVLLRKTRISNPFLVNHAPPSPGDTKDGKQKRPPFPIYTLALLHRYFWLCESLPAWEGKGRLNPRLHLQGSEQAGTRSWGVSPLYTLHLLEKK